MKNQYTIIKQLGNKIIKINRFYLILFFLPLSSYSQKEIIKYYLQDTSIVVNRMDILLPGSDYDTLFYPNRKIVSSLSNQITLIYKDTKFTQLSTRWEIENDTLFVHTVYYPNGQIWQILKSILPNYISYYSEGYYSNGQLFAKGLWYSDTLETAKIYWPNGNLKFMYNYYWGIPYGDYFEWYESGQLKMINHYCDFSIDVLIEPYGYPNEFGKWIYYKPNGEIDYEVNY